MIKIYNQFIKEGLLQHLTGPNEDEILKNLIENSDDLHEIFWKSISNGLLSGIKYVIENGLSLKKGQLMEAYIRCDYLEGVEELIKNGFPINGEKDNFPPIQTAAEYNKYDIVKYLIEHNVNIHYMWDSPFRTAASFGYYNITKILLENGAKIEELNSNTENYANIVEFNDYNLLKLLLDNGLDPNVDNGFLIRHLVSNYGSKGIEGYEVKNNDELVKLALEYGAKTSVVLNDRYYRNYIPRNLIDDFEKNNDKTYR